MKLKAIFSVIFSIGLGYIVTVETTLSLGLFCGFAIMILQSMHMMLDRISTQFDNLESLKKEKAERIKIDQERLKEELGKIM